MGVGCCRGSVSIWNLESWAGLSPGVSDHVALHANDLRQVADAQGWSFTHSGAPVVAANGNAGPAAGPGSKSWLTLPFLSSEGVHVGLHPLSPEAHEEQRADGEEGDEGERAER